MNTVLSHPTDQVLDWIEKARDAASLFAGADWFGSDPKTDDEHAAEYKSLLYGTRLSHHLPKETVMHGVSDGADHVLVFTGNTERSSLRARGIVGIMNSLPSALNTLQLVVEKSLGIEESARVQELLESNNEKLEECRRLRRENEALKRTQEILLGIIGQP